MDERSPKTGIQTTPAPINHIGIDERGLARLVGHRTRVVDIVLDTRTGMTPAQIHEAYIGLSMSKIHAALAYYYDHQQELDEIIEKQRLQYEMARAEQDKNPSPLIQRLRAMKAAGQQP